MGIFLALGSTSCNNEEDMSLTLPQTKSVIKQDTPVADIIELTSVQLQIDSLNQSMFQTPKFKSRGFKDWLNRITGVVVADALGAMFGHLYGGPIGAISTGVTSSALFALVPDRYITGPFKAPTDSLIRSVNPPIISQTPTLIPNTGLNSGSITIEDSIGYFHNMILRTLNRELASETVTVDKVCNGVAKHMAPYYHIPSDTISARLTANKNFFKDILCEQLLDTPEDADFTTTIARWKMVFPQNDTQLNLLESFFTGLANVEVDENDGTYLNKVLEILNASNLSRSTKQSLRNAIIVGNASYQLWTTE